MCVYAVTCIYLYTFKVTPTIEILGINNVRFSQIKDFNYNKEKNDTKTNWLYQKSIQLNVESIRYIRQDNTNNI